MKKILSKAINNYEFLKHSQDECSISLEILTPENSTITACGHVFLTVALADWLKKSKACPLCASVIIDSYDKSEDQNENEDEDFIYSERNGFDSQLLLTEEQVTVLMDFNEYCFTNNEVSVASCVERVLRDGLNSRSGDDVFNVLTDEQVLNWNSQLSNLFLEARARRSSGSSCCTIS